MILLSYSICYWIFQNFPLQWNKKEKNYLLSSLYHNIIMSHSIKLISTYILGALFGAGLLYLSQHYQIISQVQQQIAPSSQEGALAQASNAQVKGLSDRISHTPPPSPTPTIESPEQSFIRQKMEEMTIKEKIGQMFIWQISEKTLSERSKQIIQETQPGGVILMGNRTLSDLSVITKQLQSINTKLPLFIAIDQEGGVVKRLIDDPNPGAPALGKKDDKELCDVIKNTSELLKENGVNVNFGIVADIAWYQDSFIENRTFGTDVEKVTHNVEQAVTCSKGVFSTVKHYPGHGRTKLNSHVTIPVIKTPAEDWKQTDALPFQKAIDAGVDIMMMGHLIYSDIASEPASLSPKHIQQVRDMGFQGVITTDDMGMLESSGKDAYESLNKAINSGIDMILYVRTKEEPIDLYQHAVENVVKNKTMENRIDESVKRILRMKYSIL